MLPENERKMKAIVAEVQDLVDGRTHLTGKRFNARVDTLLAEAEQIERDDKNSSQMRNKFMRGPGEAGDIRTKAISAPNPRWRPPRPSDATEEQLHSLWMATKSNVPFQFELGPGAAPTFNMGTVRTKQVAEGAPGTLLPPALLPQHTLNLPYEPDRIFDHFMGATADSQSIQYLQHSGNTSPALPTAELGTKTDLGQQWTPHTVSFQKIAALSSASTEILDDFPVFSQFLVNDLTRAVIDAETNWIINQSVTGINWQTNTLTRLIGADTPLDALEKAVDDIRVGSAFATADKMAMHPKTLGYLKRQKSTLNTYILNPDPQTGLVDKVWNCDVVQNSYIPLDLVVVWDSSQAIYGWTRQALTVATNPYGSPMWQTNYISYRAEERIAIGYPRPTAINLVTGFPSAGS